MKNSARFTSVTLIMLILFLTVTAAHAQKVNTWGDQGNGTYINPILDADYSDPDVIQVKGKYYMVCSEFHYMGMPVLESEDMVNWSIIAHVYDSLGFPAYDSMQRYASGSWAPSIRYHDGRFWVYFCTSAEGLFMSSAVDPTGPWSQPLLVESTRRWEDPCPFWDDDGKAYLGHSLIGAGPIIIHKMSPDGTKLLDAGVTVYTGPVAEGTKIYKRNGYYYISIPEGGVEKGWQTVLRSKGIYGPYEKKVVLEQGTTNVNGPHQGALVETPGGQLWFYHFQSAGATGRVVHLEPGRWQDDWPVIGVDIDRNGIGEPVKVWPKPDVGGAVPFRIPQSDDDFDSDKLGLQWQWNHNPVDAAWSLSSNPGCLSLHALHATAFMEARNTLTQKTMGSVGEASVELDANHFSDGQRAGLASMSSVYNLAGLTMKKGKLYLFYQGSDGSNIEQPVRSRIVYLKASLDTTADRSQFYYSFDNRNFTSFGRPFRLYWGFWKGTRIALFSYNDLTNGGTALFRRFRYRFDGPANVLCTP